MLHTSYNKILSFFLFAFFAVVFIVVVIAFFTVMVINVVIVVAERKCNQDVALLHLKIVNKNQIG